MARHPLRRSQLVRPFGVGSMSTFPDGVSLMVAGLDHWYGTTSFDQLLDPDEFVVEEWRLERRLRLDHLRLPPDHRPARGQKDQPNLGMTIPAVRFPEMHVCQRCSGLTEVPATERGRVKCPACDKEGRWGRLTQVQFVAMCQAGHVQDFPFREWVHRSVSPTCHLPLRLYGSSGSSLVSVFVECGCSKRRNLSGITGGIGDDRTVLTDQLASSRDDERERYLCRGARPWLGRHDREECDLPVRAGLRSASNTYFPSTVASVYVPREQAGVPADVAAKLELPPVSTWLRTLRDVGVEPTASQLRSRYPGLVPDGVDDGSLDAWLQREDGDDDAPDLEDTSEESFRLLEYDALSSSRNDRQLTVRQLPADGYAPWLTDIVDRIGLVERLRVTTAFTGFARIGGDAEVNQEELDRRTRMLWSAPPDGPSWLPASIVYGEGIFLRFDLDRLEAWETRPEVAERSTRLERLYATVTERRKTSDRAIPPRLVLLHTLAHLLIDQLAFEAGYSATSLAERLYISETRGMAGILVYTAAGDSEGTLGGLVRLGRPGLLEPLIQRAVDRSRWCSSDPVCSELGEAGGQGPDSCNLAACHDCSILPETACEEFNRFLDRHLVSAPALGYLDAPTPSSVG